MKKLLLLATLAILIIAACQPNAKVDVVDMKAANKAIDKLSDTYLLAWNTKDQASLIDLTSDEGIFFGSDPSEILDKKGLTEMFSMVFSDTTTDYSYIVNLREIKLAKDGKSGLVIEHINMNGWSPEMPMRQTFQFVKSGSDWKIEFISWGFLIQNEKVQKLNMILN